MASTAAVPLSLLHAPQVGSQTPVYSITAEHAELKARNDSQRKRVEEIVTERLNTESRSKKVEHVDWGGGGGGLLELGWSQV